MLQANQGSRAILESQGSRAILESQVSRVFPALKGLLALQAVRDLRDLRASKVHLDLPEHRELPVPPSQWQ